LADCDVDAADLHLVLQPEIRARHEFRSGHEAVIRQPDCVQCGACLARCRFHAVKMTGRGAGDAVFTVEPAACEGCGVCVWCCPVKAIDFPECVSGEWYVSDTRHGPMVHARLGIAAENSGKLVSLVRQQAKRIAEEQHRDLVLVDGPPGIGCPVIASVTGSSLVLIITEPTLSGRHDLERVAELARHFRIPAAVCVNKWDLNPAMTEAIETGAAELGVAAAGRIGYDRAVTDAQVAGRNVLEFQTNGVVKDIKRLWSGVTSLLGLCKNAGEWVD